MNVLYALLCEEVATRSDGRVDAQGVFHHLYAPGFPAQQDQMVLAVTLEWDRGEAGRTEFRIDLLAPDQSPALTISGHTEIGRRGPGEPAPQTRLVMPLERVVFPVEGTYRFELRVGDERTPLCPLHLLKMPADIGA